MVMDDRRLTVNQIAAAVAYSNKNVNDVALIRHLATSNIANFMWYNFLLVKK